MIDDRLRPIVTEFIVEMLNDPRCKSILLDAGEDARIESGLPVLYLDIAGKYHNYTLSIVGNEYSGSIRYATGETRTIVEGGTRTWELQELLDDFRTRLQGES